MQGQQARVGAIRTGLFLAEGQKPAAQFEYLSSPVAPGLGSLLGGNRKRHQRVKARRFGEAGGGEQLGVDHQYDDFAGSGEHAPAMRFPDAAVPHAAGTEIPLGGAIGAAHAAAQNDAQLQAEVHIVSHGMSHTVGDGETTNGLCFRDGHRQMPNGSPHRPDIPRGGNWRRIRG